MAHAQSLPAPVRQHLARQLGVEVPLLIGPVAEPSRSATLAESFPVWMLPLDSLAESTDGLRGAAEPTGRWHHQIKLDGRAVAYAQSRPFGPGPEDWKITAVFESALAEKIDRAIDRVDREATGDQLVRLLDVPTYHLTAFWLSGDREEVMLVDVPRYMPGLARERLIGSGDFLELLRSIPHIVGRADSRAR